MQKITQKFHGLPSMGIKGRPGEKGKIGQNLYIGFINDFFDYIPYEIDSLVYYTYRKENDNSDKAVKDSSYKKWMDSVPRVANTETVTPTGIYYSGEYLSDNKNFYDAANGINSLTNDRVFKPGEAINDELTGDLADSYDYISI